MFLGLELREDITTMLEPGMVVSMEPMIMVPPEKPGAGGYRYEVIKGRIKFYKIKKFKNLWRSN